jgi:signal transduction histidine kinase
MHVASPIELNGKQLGTVHLRATMAPAYARLRLEIAAVVIILLLAALLAFVLSASLHRFISLPVLSLARAAKAVSDRKDYSIRAVKHSQDELGGLADAFNEMLAQIEARDSELRQRTAELLKANRAKDEFLATLSHELRTPLNSILGWSILVQEGRLSDERERTAFQAIERNARLQSRLIEDLLDVSRIISGKFTLDLSEIALRPIVEGALEITRPIAETKHIRVQAYWPPEALHVSGDGARLQQAIWNLLSNAVKFTGENGSIEVRLEKSGDRARISVSDNGIGIEEEFLPYVFERFRQADASSTRAFGGLGLGLAIARHIVEMHGGSVRAESMGKTHGATFTIELPLLVRPGNKESASLRGSLRE